MIKGDVLLHLSGDWKRVKTVEDLPTPPTFEEYFTHDIGCSEEGWGLGLDCRICEWEAKDPEEVTMGLLVTPSHARVTGVTPTGGAAVEEGKVGEGSWARSGAVESEFVVGLDLGGDTPVNVMKFGLRVSKRWSDTCPKADLRRKPISTATYSMSPDGMQLAVRVTSFEDKGPSTWTAVWQRAADYDHVRRKVDGLRDPCIDPCGHDGDGSPQGVSGGGAGGGGVPDVNDELGDVSREALYSKVGAALYRDDMTFPYLIGDKLEWI